MEWDRTLGQRLKREMQFHGYTTNRAIADFLGYSHVSQISAMLNGDPARALKMQDAEKLEREWGILKNWFFGIGGKTAEETEELKQENLQTGLSYLRTLGIDVVKKMYWHCSTREFELGRAFMTDYIFKKDQNSKLSSEILDENANNTLDSRYFVELQSKPALKKYSKNGELFDNRGRAIGFFEYRYLVGFALNSSLLSPKSRLLFCDAGLRGARILSPDDMDRLLSSISHIARAAAESYIETLCS